MEDDEPLLIATDASKQETRSMAYTRAREIINSERVVNLIFGTAWGLDSEVIKRADYVLDPIEGSTGYNHLSVRTAVAIILDRLTGSH